MILALLGDNPMQSEFACHIGLGGKFFCRACWVKGSDALAEQVNESHGGNQEGTTSDNESVAGSEVTEDGGGGSDGEFIEGKKSKGRGKRALESMSNMVNRVKSFMKVCTIAP
jgi:hypothetical protein